MMPEPRITFTDAAIDDLRRLGPDAVPKVLKKTLLLLDNVEAGYPLGGDRTGFRKLVVGRNTWRIVYRVTDDKTVEICEVWAVGERADSEIYAEASARVKATGASSPDLVRLVTVIERLGGLAGGVEPPAEEVREPVPQWLADRLVYTVGMRPEAVAALDLRQAVDVWTEHTARPH
ncbi:mRNA interferase RelE/StbE [Murinocardiopsis flavida]|uniref:mRNA interferase RelE/StbE n=1 Tax=Murinocardiopsis flavida TaxID=645275 RepID=A0A2P8DQH3_9ACTN|nr:type II toxin-antitoxin system RelE/ParE family toxin [Murinocardiopsis flavida]PSK99477.1 mRNA interferase RelE/StbE [Murinocardiopsis flavida]